MFHHFIFIEKLAEALQEHLTGAVLVECFSQNKDELILSFLHDEKEFYIKASLEPQISLLSFPNPFHRSNKNSVDLFQGLIEGKVDEIYANKHDRSFVLSFTGGRHLLFKMHGNRSNIIFFKDGEVIELFLSRLNKDRELQSPDIGRNLDETDLKQDDLLVLEKILGKYSRAFETNGDKEKILRLLNTLRNSKLYISEESKPDISFFPSDDNPQPFSTPLEACNILYRKITSSYLLELEKDKIQKDLHDRIRKSKAYIEKTQRKIDELKSKRPLEEVANIIMAHLHQIPPHYQEVSLPDIYGDGDITIKLKKDLSPQKNAEVYYRKAKNQHKEIAHIQESIEAKTSEIKNLEAQLTDIQQVEHHKDLKSFRKKQPAKKATETLPYHLFNYKGYEILVGRNAKMNDQLTFSHTHKNDLWMHARDVPGSHVVIKGTQNGRVPEPILEYAATLAAAYSKNKNNSLIPVSYTLKKYVRKPKGLPPGKVIMDREEVILVKPDPR